MVLVEPMWLNASVAGQTGTIGTETKAVVSVTDMSWLDKPANIWRLSEAPPDWQQMTELVPVLDLEPRRIGFAEQIR